MTEIARLYATVTADTSKLEKSLQGVKRDLTSTEKGFASFQSAVTVGFKAIGIAAAAAFAGMAAGMASTIKAAAKFEQNVTDIGAVMNLTAKETENLQKHILDLGLDDELKVSATEASDAIMQLGTAGLSMTQIMGGASKATIALSNSTGGDMASSASLLTDIMSQFKIEASDAGRIIDQVTGLTVASKFAFGDAALAISQAGGMAGAVGVEFEDFNAILGVTAANFSSGSDAGTSLKTFLTTLIPKSVEAADTMRKLGLFTGLTGKEFEDTQADIAKLRERITELDPTSKKYSENVNKLNAEINELSKGLVAGGSAFFDANGNMKDAESIAQALQNAFGGLSDARRNDALQTIFGNDAMRTAAGLIDAGTAGITKMKEEIDKVNAGDIAAKRMDTFAGAVEIAMGVIETISISIGQKFLPVLRPLVEQFASLAETQGPKLVAFFGTFADKMAQLIQQGMDWMQRVLVPMWERFTQIGKAINTVTGIIMQALNPITNTINKWVKWQDVLAAVGLLLGGAVLASIAGVVAALTPVILLVGKVALAIGLMRKAWDENFLGIRDITQGALNGISKWLQDHTSIWQGTWNKTLKHLVKNGDTAWRQLYGDIKHWFSLMWGEAKHIVLTWIDTTERKINNWVTVTGYTLARWRDWGIRYFREFTQWAGEELEKLLGWFIPQEWIDKGKNIIKGLWDGAKERWSAFSAWFKGAWQDLVDRFKDFFGISSPSTLFAGFGSDMMEGLQRGIDAGANLVFDSMDRMVGGIAGKLEEIPGMIDRSNAVVAMEAFQAKLKFLEEASKSIGPYWLQPGYEAPASTLPPVLADPNAGMGGIQFGNPKATVNKAPSMGSPLSAWYKREFGDALIQELGSSQSYIAKLQQLIKPMLTSIKLSGEAAQGSSAMYMAIQRLTSPNLYKQTVGTVMSDAQMVLDANKAFDPFTGTDSEDWMMKRNNELLTILIQELRNKNLTTNVLVQSNGSGLSELVQHANGLRL